MLRKFGRVLASSSTDSVESESTVDASSQRPPYSHDYRAASEPSENILASLPYHIAGGKLAHQASAASSSFSRIGLQRGSTSQVPFASDEPYGLTIVHESANPYVDFIFVHGLGGSSFKTWSWNRDTDHFWPVWLSLDIDLAYSRIFTFGYNANIKGSSSNLNIIEFAKDLLLRMLTFSGGIAPARPIGTNPIVFVAHSMGGLVFKKAYILAKSDEKYSRLVPRIHGMLFLSTSHKGSNYAHTLNTILNAAPTTAQKIYVSELELNSTTLQDINEQFRTMCGDLTLVSFYESLKTSIGPGIKKFVVEKESGLLGYPQETSSSLNADHHTVCKYKTLEDPNYIDVRDMLKWMTSKLNPGTTDATYGRPSTINHGKRLEDILCIQESPSLDFGLYRAEVSEGSCRWITNRPSFLAWIGAYGDRPRIYWMTGPPATGKSTIAAFVAEYLQTGFLEAQCQYHFFRSTHQFKRTTSYCLRSIAFQLAVSNEAFRSRLLALNEQSGMTFGSEKVSSIWEKIFVGLLFTMPITNSLYWVIDALDEAESPATLLNLFKKLHAFSPVKIFLTSRMSKELSVLTRSHAEMITNENLSIADTLPDIKNYVRDTVNAALPCSAQFQEDMVAQVLAKSSGSFLWVKLALNTLKDNWHTEEDVRRALHDVPSGMESLYQKMVGTVMGHQPRLRDIALKILGWVACASRPLRLLELKVALSGDFGDFLSLEDTIIQLCGHFVRVENSRILLIHATARQFLFDNTAGPAIIEFRQGHDEIAQKCLDFLSDDKWRLVFTQTSEEGSMFDRIKRAPFAIFEEEHPFLWYSLENWSYHVSNASLDSESLMLALIGFLNRHCLAWIHAIALSRDLQLVIRASQNLKAYLKRRSHKKPQEPDLTTLKSPIDENTDVVKRWAVDLIRVVGKFGTNLAENPASIYRLVPPFCPRGSQIWENNGHFRGNTLSVEGITSSAWDDCLARLNVGEDETASRVICTGPLFVTLIGSSGTLIIWHAETCAEARRMVHGEWVTLMTVNKSGTLIATSGLHTHRVWEIKTGKEIYRLPKQSHARAMAISFGMTDSTLLVGRDDFSISCFDLETRQERWNYLARDPSTSEDNCPRLMAFSPDTNRVAVACRGKPVHVWDMTRKGVQRPKRCIRTEDRDRDHGDAWNAPELVSWHPDGSSLLILYQDTTIVDWQFLEDEQSEYDHIEAREMIVSPDGNFLLTSNHNGSLSVWIIPRLNLLYRLHYDEFVRDLAFSPSGQRFYDTRGSICNVWEPDALVRPEDLDHDDVSSNSELSISSEPIYSKDDNSRNQITALACDATNKYYACGNDEGVVYLHDLAQGKRLRKCFAHSSTVCIVALAWSISGKYLVSGDDSGRVIAKRLENKELGKWSVFPVFDIRISETVEQVLFHPKEHMVLVSTRSTDRVWNVKTKEEMCRRRWPFPVGRRWITHPLKNDILLWMDPDAVLQYEWPTLKCLDYEQAERSPQSMASTQRPALPQSSSQPSEDAENVNWVSRTKNRRYIICETLPDTGHTRARSAQGIRIEILPTSKLESWKEAGPEARRSLPDLAKYVARLIGSYQDRVVFLDHQSWLCTWEIDTDFSKYKRHFFLPRDWLSTSTLQLAVLNVHGTFLCPKNGEVAIVKNGVKL